MGDDCGTNVEFRVLGPVELLVDGVPIALGGRKPRTLLAMLLLHPNEPVPVATLVDALWADDPPRSAAANLRTYLTALRAVLPPRRLRAGDGRVLLRVEPGELDSARFDELAGRAAQAVADDDRALAVRFLGQAVARWRGPVGAGLSYGPSFAAAAARLDDRLVNTTEDYTEHLVSLGEYDVAVRELRRLLSAHPFRERAWARLMTALWRQGDTAAALEAYRQARSVFVEELGVEPPSELRELQRAMLSGASAGGSPAPQQVPRRLPDFVGRHAEIERLVGRLGRRRPQECPVVVIHGLAGVGKSALATEVAYRVRASFPDGCLHIDLRGASAGSQPLSSAAVLGRFLRALGSSDDGCADVDEASARFRSVVSGRRLLMVLDNATDSRQLRPLLPAGSGCAVIVTARRRLASLESTDHLELGGLPVHESVWLLARLIGSERVASERAAAVDIVERCARLPLALRLVAGRLSARPAWSLSQMADRLADSARCLDELSVEDIAVRSSFEVSYRSLLVDDGLAARAFRLLGVAGLPAISVPAATALLDRPPATVEASLERLVDDHLLESQPDGRYRLHDLLRLYARECAEADTPAEERQAAVVRLLDWYLSRLKSANEVWSRAPEDAGTWLAAECDNVLALARQEASGHDAVASLVLAVADELVTYLDYCRHWRDLLEICRIAVEVAEAVGDLAAMARAQLHLSRALFRAGRLTEAADHADQSLRLCRRTGDRLGEAKALNNLGLVHLRRAGFEAAIACFRDAIEIRRQAGDRRGELTALDNLGLVYERAEAMAEALTCHQRSRELARELGDLHLEGLCLINIANTHRLAGRFDDSIHHYEQALDICRRFGNQRGEAYSLLGLGTCLGEVGRRDPARDCLELAVILFERLGLATDAAVAKDVLATT